VTVWELIAKLIECPAGATVHVGVNATLNVEATEFELDDGNVSLRASGDVECAMSNGGTEWLSSLVERSEC